MNDLASGSCEACRIDAPIVSDDEASLLIKEIEGWDLINDGVKKLKKEFSFSNYSDSVDFSNKVAGIAEQEDHHPQIILVQTFNFMRPPNNSNFVPLQNNLWMMVFFFSYISNFI